MGKIGLHEPVKLFVGFITNDIELIERAKQALEKKFGRVDSQSEILDFNYTTYYRDELGDDLKRRFVTFRKLIKLEKPYAIKLFTNRLESRFGAHGKRKINIDPGYISPSKLVLFTTKDFYHRIYLGKGIYAEPTLYYKAKAFQQFEWSYPDYRSAEYTEFFTKVRQDYLIQLRRARC